MSREEAINLLSQMRKDGEGFLSDNTIEAYDMAIEALEQERSRLAQIIQYRNDCEKLMQENEQLKKALKQEPYFWEKCPYYEPDIMFDEKDEYDMGKCTYKQEQEPCEDAISRQAVLNCLTATGLKKFDYILNARDKIKNLPSVKPQEPRWIPVSEQLPEERDWYLAVFKEKDTGYQLIPRVADYIGENNWRIIDEEAFVKNYHDILKCVAWMPLPKPYKAESEES